MYQENSEKEIKEQGLKVIDSRLVIKEKEGGVKGRLCARNSRTTRETTSVCRHPAQR